MGKKFTELISRREFMVGAIGLLNSLIAAFLAVPGVGYLLTPLLRKHPGDWIRIGPLNRFAPGAPRKALFTYRSASGYQVGEKSGFVWILRRREDSPPVVYSPVCTHMGCNVSWTDRERKFKCPCHGGEYDIDGNVIAGPPPRPLDRLAVKVEHDELYIKLPG